MNEFLHWSFSFVSFKMLKCYFVTGSGRHFRLAWQPTGLIHENRHRYLLHWYKENKEIVFTNDKLLSKLFKELIIYQTHIRTNHWLHYNPCNSIFQLTSASSIHCITIVQYVILIKSHHRSNTLHYREAQSSAM